MDDAKRIEQARVMQRRRELRRDLIEKEFKRRHEVYGNKIEEKTVAVEISFPVPVYLANRWLQGINDMVAEICKDYEALHPDRTMWPFGCGAKMRYNHFTDDEEKLTFDETIDVIDVAERENYDAICGKCGKLYIDHMTDVTDIEFRCEFEAPKRSETP